MFYYTYIKYELKGNYMIIRTLKRMLISVAFIALVLNDSIINAVNTQNQKPIKSNSANTQTSSGSIQDINKLIKGSSENLDKINSVLEFTAQAITKGTIVLQSKIAAKKWIKNNQDNIEFLEKSLNAFDINIAQIYKINCVSKSLVAHIQTQLEEGLQNIKIVQINLDAIIFKRSQLKQITPKLTEQLIRTNLKQILGLQEKANKIGLTAVNRTTRKLEQLNDKYQITKVLNILPPVLLLGIAAIYYTPKDKFTEGSFLSKLKNNFIGVSKHTDNTAYNTNRTNNSNGLLHTLLTIWEKDSGKLSLALAALVAYANKDSLASTFPELGHFLSTVSDTWQRFKGYEVKSSSRYEIIEKLTLDDERIIGLGDQKQKLQQTLEYIANPEMYDRQQSGPGKAMIIVGPSGNGKTLLAKALAGSLNKLLKKNGSRNRMAFKEIKWAEVAWTREGLKRVIEQAKPHAPCILFFDELHTLPLQTKENTPTLTDLLTELDGVNSENSSSNQIIFVAATNQPEMLDAALLRTGRFGMPIFVEKPTFETRKQYFEVMCKRYSINAANIDLDLISRQTAGCSYSDLDTILKDARFQARREIRSTNQRHIQDRILKRIFRLKDDSSLNDFEKKHLSANIAGSALVSLLLDPQEKLEMATIKGRWKKIKESRYWDNEVRKKMTTAKNTKYGAIFTYNPNEQLNITDDNEKVKQCKIKIASYLAEEVLLKSRSSKVSTKNDKNPQQKNKQKALEIIQSMLFDTFEKEFMSKQMKQESKAKVYEIFKQYEQEVRDILVQNYSLLVKIASELEAQEILTAAELTNLMTNVQ